MKAESASLTLSESPAATTAVKQRGRPFARGRSGNPLGRPIGAKNKLTDVFLSTIAADFWEHGAEALSRVRAQDPASYLKIIAGLIPRELVLQREEKPIIDYADLSDLELGELLMAARRRKQIKKALESI